MSQGGPRCNNSRHDYQRTLCKRTKEINHMTIFEFVEQLCDIIGGEDAYYRFEKDELIAMCKEMSESHRKAEEEIAGAV